MLFLRTILASVAALSSCLWSSTATAHHSPAGFDLSKQVVVTGSVTRVEWFNPHVYVYVEEAASAGQKVEWEIECFAPNVLRRMGWNKDALRIGQRVTVTGSPAKSENKKAIFPSSIKDGDRTLFSMQDAMRIYSPDAAPKPTSKAASLNGIWAAKADMQTLAQAMIVDPKSLTKEGADALKRFDEKTIPAARCVPSPAPWPMIFPDLKRITVDDRTMIIEAEFDNSRRTIHLDAATHVGAASSIQGHSIARWEGKTLTIDTTNFAYHGNGNTGGFGGVATGLPSSTQKHLVERLTPSEDGRELTYSFELTDPVFLTEPKAGTVRWNFTPDEKFSGEPCNVDNAGRFTRP